MRNPKYTFCVEFKYKHIDKFLWRWRRYWDVTGT